MIDFNTFMYDPVYAALGVPGTLTIGTDSVTLTVVDDTRTKRHADASGVETVSVGPGAFVRIPELTASGVTRDQCIGASLTFNGHAWTILTGEPRGSPNGEDLGEIRFTLNDG